MTDSAYVESLLAAAAAGNRDAQATLLRCYWPMIRQIVRVRRARIRRPVRSRDETADLEQDVAMRILKDLPSHVWHGRKAFAAWICQLATRQVIDNARFHGARKRDPAAEIPLDWHPGASGRSPESRLDEGRRLLDLQKRLASMKPEYSAALLLHHMGFAHAEIGDLLGCTAEAARKLVCRARLKLV